MYNLLKHRDQSATTLLFELLSRKAGLRVSCQPRRQLFIYPFRGFVKGSIGRGIRTLEEGRRRETFLISGNWRLTLVE